MKDVEAYFLLFVIYSILGWVIEVVFKLFQYHRFVNRGFLIGPYCPIYGYGAHSFYKSIERIYWFFFV